MNKNCAAILSSVIFIELAFAVDVKYLSQNLCATENQKLPYFYTLDTAVKILIYCKLKPLAFYLKPI